MIESSQPKDWLDVVKEMRASQRSNGRIRLLEAQASLLVGDLETVDRFFKDGVIVADLREGEGSLTDLWFDFQAKRVSIAEDIPLDEDLIRKVKENVPVPESIDFRLKSGIGV